MLPIVDLFDRGRGGERSPTALIASCGQLQGLMSEPFPGCADQPRRHRAAPGSGPVLPPGPVPGMLPGRAAVMLAPAVARANGVAGHERRGAVIEVKPTLAAWQDVQARIVAANPGYQVRNFYQRSLRPATVGLWLLLGVTVASMMTVLSGAVLALEAAWLRKHELFALRAIGVQRRQLRGAQLTEGVLAGAVAVAFALIGAIGMTAYWYRLRGDPFPALAPYFLAAACGLGAVVGIARASSLVISKRLPRA